VIPGYNRDFSPPIKAETRARIARLARNHHQTGNFSGKGGAVSTLSRRKSETCRHADSNAVIGIYCSLPVEVSPFGSSCSKMELVSEKIESVSVDDEPKRELSDGICQDGNVESGLGTTFADVVFVSDFGFFPSLTYTITILCDSWQLLHRPV
jgi:hypothetical protein